MAGEVYDRGPFVSALFASPALVEARRHLGSKADELLGAPTPEGQRYRFSDFKRFIDDCVARLGPDFPLAAGRAAATPRVLGVTYTLLRTAGSPLDAMRLLLAETLGLEGIAQVDVLDAIPGRLTLRYTPHADAPDSEALRAYRRAILEAVPEIFGSRRGRTRDVAPREPTEPTLTEVRWRDLERAHRHGLNLLVGLAYGIPVGVIVGFMGLPPPLPGTLTFLVANIYLGMKEQAWLRRARRVHDEEVSALGQALDESRRNFVKLREAQRSLAEINATLEERVHTQARELAQSAKMAAMGTLVAGLCHELNNPNHVIAGQLALLARELPEDGRASRAVAAIGRSSVRIQTLVDELLMFARRGERDPGACHPARIVAQALEQVDGLNERVCSLDLGLLEHVEIAISEGAFESIITNLVANAIDATPRAGRIEVRLRLVGTTVELTVRDHGTGMTPEVRQRIFEPFFTTKAPGSGTGLGLAIVWQIVTQSGGEVRVESELGVGTSMSVRAPIASTRAVAAHKSAEVDKSSSRQRSKTESDK